MRQQIVAICGSSIICLLLFGCVTGPTYSSLQSTIPPVASGKGRVFLYRFLTHSIIKNGPEILIDGQSIGPAKEGVLFVDLPLGRHTASGRRCIDTAAKPIDPGHFFYRAGQSVEFNLNLGKPVYILFEPNPEVNAGLRMILVDPAQGSQEIADLPYVGQL
jgi:hypothetical protein